MAFSSDSHSKVTGVTLSCPGGRGGLFENGPSLGFCPKNEGSHFIRGPFVGGQLNADDSQSNAPTAGFLQTPQWMLCVRFHVSVAGDWEERAKPKVMG